MQQMLEQQGDIPITIDESWVTHNLNSYVRGYHAYMNIWNNPLIGDDGLVCVKEGGNNFDQYAVAIVKEGNVVGHVPANLSKFGEEKLV